MKYLNKSRGVSCDSSQIIVCSGFEHCISLLSQMLQKYYNTIAMEDPGYIGAKTVFSNNGFNIKAITLKNDEIDLSQLEKSSSQVIYVTPSHQFPTGTVMSIQKRLELLDWARRKNGIIVEDDYDSELRYNSRPIPSIQSITSEETVIYIGTFSKCLSPSLRISYMVLPSPYLKIYESLLRNYQNSVPLLQQKILQQFMFLGHFDTHLRKICLANKRKHDLLITTINYKMGDMVTIHGKNAGLHIILEVNNGFDEKKLINYAEKKGVQVYPVSTFWINLNSYSNNMVLLGFGAMSESEILEGVKLLTLAWFEKDSL
jgi:GntR family transcriptional regulator/MocR family aminotransferase